MSNVATLFMIMPPNELNDDIVAKKELFENYMSVEFPGYKFELVDLRLLRPVGRGQKVQFGDGTKFAVMPMLGATGGRFLQMPDVELLREISQACEKFDVVKTKRYVA